MSERDEERIGPQDSIAPGYAQAMKEHGFGWNTRASIRKITCPNCGFMFSLTYGRTIACRGCPQATKSCPKARCAKCDHEFYIQEMPHVGNRYAQRSVADHMSSIEATYNEQVGRKRHR